MTPPSGVGGNLEICLKCPGGFGGSASGETEPLLPQPVSAQLSGRRRKRLERLRAEAAQWSLPRKRGESARSSSSAWGRWGPEPSAPANSGPSPGFPPPLRPEAEGRVTNSEPGPSSERRPRTRVPAWPPGPPASVGCTQLPWEAPQPGRGLEAHGAGGRQGGPRAALGPGRSQVPCAERPGGTACLPGSSAPQSFGACWMGSF